MAPHPRIGTTIRRARERKQMRQQDLAEAVGVSRTTVDAWENDRAYPRNRIGALEEVLGITIEPESGPGPLDDLKPWRDDWEAQVANDSDMPVDWRRDLIGDSRRARRAYAERRAQRRAREAG